MLTLVISGGQTGADLAGVVAAKALNIMTGGQMPRGWRTEAGPQPGYRVQYNMTENTSDKYPPRTLQNVADADATLILAPIHSSGSNLTKKYAEQLRKPFLWVATFDNPEVVVTWLQRYNVQTLNVAGNSESHSPGIFEEAVRFLHGIFVTVTTVPVPVH